MTLVNSVRYLDRHYVAMPHCSSSCQIVVVATRNNTLVKFNFPRHLWNISSNIVDGLFCTQLKVNDVFRIEAHDLEGVIISANNPVSAFTGENFTSNGNLHKDHTFTAIVNYWGIFFIVVKEKDPPDVVKIIASSNGTKVSLSGDCDRNVQLRSLNEFQIQTEILSCSYMVVQSNFPVQVVHLSSRLNGDFSLYYVSPVEYFSNKYIVNTVGSTAIELRCKITLIIEDRSASGIRLNFAELPTTTRWTMVDRTSMVYTRINAASSTSNMFTHQNGEVFGGSLVCGTRYQTLATSMRPSYDQNFDIPSNLDLSVTKCPKFPNDQNDQTLTFKPLLDATTDLTDITTNGEYFTSPYVTTASTDVPILSNGVTTEPTTVTEESSDVTTEQVNLTFLSKQKTTKQADVTTKPVPVTYVPNDVTSVPNEVTSVPNDVTSVPNDVTSVQNDVTSLLNDATFAQNDVTSIPNDVTSVPIDVTSDVTIKAITLSEHITTSSQKVNTLSGSVLTESANIITDSGVTARATTQTKSAGITTSLNNATCSQQCTTICRRYRHINIEDLRVDKLNTVRSIRSRTSAIDNRFSAVCMGCVAILVLVTFLIVLILADTMAHCKATCTHRNRTFCV